MHEKAQGKYMIRQPVTQLYPGHWIPFPLLSLPQCTVFSIDFVISPDQYLYVRFVFAAKAKQYAMQVQRARPAGLL